MLLYTIIFLITYIMSEKRMLTYSNDTYDKFSLTEKVIVCFFGTAITALINWLIVVSVMFAFTQISDLHAGR